MKSSKQAWEEQKRMLKEDSEKQASRLEDLEKQNALLHGHLEENAAKLTALQRERLPTAASMAEVEASTSASGDSALLEVIRFQRSQTEVSEATGAGLARHPARSHACELDCANGVRKCQV